MRGRTVLTTEYQSFDEAFLESTNRSSTSLPSFEVLISILSRCTQLQTLLLTGLCAPPSHRPKSLNKIALRRRLCGRA